MQQNQRQREFWLQVLSGAVVLAYPLGLGLHVHQTGQIHWSDPVIMILMIGAGLTWIIALRLNRSQPCPSCYRRVSKSAYRCTFCGAFVKRKKKKIDGAMDQPELMVVLPNDDLPDLLVKPEEPTTLDGVLWNPKAKKRIEVVVQGYQQAGLSRFMHIAFSEELDQYLSEVRTQFKTDRYLFQVNTRIGRVFVQLRFEKIGVQTAYFRVTDEAYRLEQRMQPRANIDPDSTVRVQFKLNKFAEGRISQTALEGFIQDVSEGGIGFYIVTDLGDDLQIGDQVTDGEFILQDNTIKFEGEVRHFMRFHQREDGVKYKVGISFTEISGSSRQYISSYVFDFGLSKFMDR